MKPFLIRGFWWLVWSIIWGSLLPLFALGIIPRPHLPFWPWWESLDPWRQAALLTSATTFLVLGVVATIDEARIRYRLWRIEREHRRWDAHQRAGQEEHHEP